MKSATMISAQEFSLHSAAAERPITRAPLRFEAPRMVQEPLEAPAVHLTPRQLEVLSLLCEGLPNKLICRRLNISTGTVKVHISGILRGLGVMSRLQAVVSARRYGLVGELTAGAEQPAADNIRFVAAD